MRRKDVGPSAHPKLSGSVFRGARGHRGVTWRPQPSQEPKAGQGDGDTKAGAAMGRDSDQKLCVCVCVCVCVYPPTSTQPFTPMFVHVHAFILFGLLGVFFLFSSFPSLQLISLPSFLLSLANTVLPPSFLFLFSLRLCLCLHLCLLFPCFSICHPTLHRPISLLCLSS